MRSGGSVVYLSISYRTVSKYRLSEIYRISNTFRYGFRYRYRYDNIEKFDTIYSTRCRNESGLLFRSKNTLPGTIYPPFSLRLTFQLLPVYSQAPVSVVSRVCLRPSVLRCWRALLLCVLPFCNLFPRTYIRRRLIPYYDSGPLHKHQIYVRPIVHY